MSGEQSIFNLQIKKKSGLSLNPDTHHSKVFSSVFLSIYMSDIQYPLVSVFVYPVFNNCMSVSRFLWYLFVYIHYPLISVCLSPVYSSIYMCVSRKLYYLYVCILYPLLSVCLYSVSSICIFVSRII